MNSKIIMLGIVLLGRYCFGFADKGSADFSVHPLQSNAVSVKEFQPPISEVAVGSIKNSKNISNPSLGTMHVVARDKNVSADPLLHSTDTNQVQFTEQLQPIREVDTSATNGQKTKPVAKNTVNKKSVDVTNDVAITQADVTIMRSLITDIVNFGVVKSNSLLSKIMLNLNNPQDINAEYTTAKGFGSKGSRDTMQSMFSQLAPLKTIKNGMVKTGLVKSIALQDFKEKFVKTLIQKQLDNNLGIDSVSLQSRYSLPGDQQDKFVARFTNSKGKYAELFNPGSKITSVEKLQLIAEMNDEVMNVIAGSVKIDTKGDFVTDENGNLLLLDGSQEGNFGAAIFKSNYDANGNFTSIVTMPSGEGNCTVTTVFDTKGNQTSRSLGADGDEYTVVSRNGWFYGTYKTQYDGSLADASSFAKAPADMAANERPLSANSKALFDNVTDLTSAVAYLRVNTQLAMQDLQNNLTTINAKKIATTVAKTGLLAGKQYLIFQFGVVTHIPLISSALLLPIVKLISILPAMYETDPETGEVLTDVQIKNGVEVQVPKVKKLFTNYQLTGHSISDPSMLLVALKAIDLTVGDKGQIFFMRPFGGKALISGQSGRLFRQGTAPANALQWIQGKDSQKENLNETYIDGIPAALQILFTPFTILFPKRFGGTILSPADLAQIKKSQPASLVSKPTGEVEPMFTQPIIPVSSDEVSDEDAIEV